MSKPHLLACPECARHIRVDERECPFCLVSLPGWFRETTVREAPDNAPRERMNRAALYALRVGALSITAACGGSTTTADAGAEAEVAGDATLEASVASDASAEASVGESGAAVDGAAGDATQADATTTDGGANDARHDVFIAPPYGIPVYGAPP